MSRSEKQQKDSAEKAVRGMRRRTRQQHSSEEKIRIVLEGLRGEDSIAELCCQEGNNQDLYSRWSKAFLKAGKKRLAGDTARQTSSGDRMVANAVAVSIGDTDRGSLRFNFRLFL